METAVLAVVALGITVMVYGSVALIVKADDFGLMLSQRGGFAAARTLGWGIVKAMPGLMKAITAIGTAAMLWVGGSIVIHGLKDLGIKELYTAIHDLAHGFAHTIGSAEGFLAWFATATMDGLLGLALGLLLIPLVAKVIEPLWHTVSGKAGKANP